MDSKASTILSVGLVILLGLYIGSRQIRRPDASTAPSTRIDAATRPRLPAPRIRESSQTELETPPQESKIAKMLKGDGFAEVKLEQLEGYLSSNHRSVASLLAAFRLTGDRELLREAAEKFPADRRVAYESWFRTKDKAERQKWLVTWEKYDSNNSLASYLAAANLFKAGDTDAAIQKLEAAMNKTEFTYFPRESVV